MAISQGRRTKSRWTRYRRRVSQGWGWVDKKRVNINKWFIDTSSLFPSVLKPTKCQKSLKEFGQKVYTETSINAPSGSLPATAFLSLFHDPPFTWKRQRGREREGKSASFYVSWLSYSLRRLYGGLIPFVGERGCTEAMFRLNKHRSERLGERAEFKFSNFQAFKVIMHFMVFLWGFWGANNCVLFGDSAMHSLCYRSLFCLK